MGSLIAVALAVLLALLGGGVEGRRLLSRVREEMLDHNADGLLQHNEIATHLAFMADGDEGKLNEMVQLWISRYDLNKDSVIDASEFNSAFQDRLDSPGRYTADEIPEQVHISLTGKPSEVVIVWVTFANVNASVVEFGLESGKLDLAAQGEKYTYDAGFFGWDGWLHKVRVSGLKPDTQYFYRVGDGGSFVSQEFNFRTAPGTFKPGRYLAFGDMGTFMPFGLVVTDDMVQAHKANPYDLSIHLGDVSYAGTGSEREWQIVWDIWGRQVEPLGAYFPYMTTLGNHEKYFNFTAFKARLPMQGEESGGYQNYYYSFDHGGVHFVQTCSESYAAPFTPGSPQYEWLKADLAKANSNRQNVPWIVVTGHRPMYGSTDQGGWEGIRIELEPLLKQFSVDLFLSGHIHAYERTFPIYNNEVEIPADPNRYVNPKHPVHVQIGTAGAFVWERWLFPKPAWSAFRQARYGFSHFEIVNSTALHFQFFSGSVLGESTLADDFWIIKE